MDASLKVSGIVLTLTVVAVVGVSLTVNSIGKSAVPCSVERNTEAIYSHLSKAFSPEEDNDIVKEIFTEGWAQAFTETFTRMHPGPTVPTSADVVLVFSARGKTLLLFFEHACIAGSFLMSSSVYMSIKVKMRRKLPKPFKI